MTLGWVNTARASPPPSWPRREAIDREAATGGHPRQVSMQQLSSKRARTAQRPFELAALGFGRVKSGLHPTYASLRAAAPPIPRGFLEPGASRVPGSRVSQVGSPGMTTTKLSSRPEKAREARLWRAGTQNILTFVHGSRVSQVGSPGMTTTKLSSRPEKAREARFWRAGTQNILTFVPGSRVSQVGSPGMTTTKRSSRPEKAREPRFWRAGTQNILTFVPGSRVSQVGSPGMTVVVSPSHVGRC